MTEPSFRASDIENPTGTLILPNGSHLCVPKTEAGQDFTNAVARAVVEARAEWHRPA